MQFLEGGGGGICPKCPILDPPLTRVVILCQGIYGEYLKISDTGIPTRTCRCPSIDVFGQRLSKATAATRYTKSFYILYMEIIVIGLHNSAIIDRFVAPLGNIASENTWWSEIPELLYSVRYC